MAADDFNIDFTDYKDTQGEHVAPGKYTVIIEDAETGTSSNKGTPQLTLWLRVVGTDYDGSTLVENLYLTKPSRFRFVSFLKALGLKTPKGNASFKARQFLNRRVSVIVVDDEYKQKIRSRVDEWERYIPAGSSAESAEAETDEAEFGAGTDEAAVDFPDGADEEEFAFEGEAEEDLSGLAEFAGDDDALATGPGDEIPAPTTEEEVTAEAAPKAAAPKAASTPKAAAPAAAAPKTAAPSAPAEKAPAEEVAQVAAPEAEPDSLEDEVAAAMDSDDEGFDDGDTGPDDSVAFVTSDEDGEEEMELADLEDLEV